MVFTQAEMPFMVAFVDGPGHNGTVKKLLNATLLADLGKVTTDPANPK